jgi:ribosome recycling factor
MKKTNRLSFRPPSSGAVKKAIEEAEEKGEISEDDRERFMKEMDEEVKKINEELKAVRDKKEEEIMTI